MKYLVFILTIASFSSNLLLAQGDPAAHAEEESCSICLKSESEGFKPGLTHCKTCQKSMGCESCVADWFKGQNTCPLCRSEHSDADVAKMIEKNREIKAIIARNLAQQIDESVGRGIGSISARDIENAIDRERQYSTLEQQAALRNHAVGRGIGSISARDIENAIDRERQRLTPEQEAALRNHQAQIYENQLRASYRLPEQRKQEITRELAAAAEENIRRHFRLEPQRAQQVRDQETERAVSAVRNNFVQQERSGVERQERERILANYERGIYLLQDHEKRTIRERIEGEMREAEKQKTERETRQQNAGRTFLTPQETQQIQKDTLDRMHAERRAEYERDLRNKQQEFKSNLEWSNTGRFIYNGLLGWFTGYYQYHDVLRKVEEQMKEWISANRAPVR